MFKWLSWDWPLAGYGLVVSFLMLLMVIGWETFTGPTLTWQSPRLVRILALPWAILLAVFVLLYMKLRRGEKFWLELRVALWDWLAAATTPRATTPAMVRVHPQQADPLPPATPVVGDMVGKGEVEKLGLVSEERFATSAPLPPKA